MAEKHKMDDFGRRNKDVLSRDILGALLWLGFLAFVNQTASHPILFIFPYLIPVVFMGWRWGTGWGFLFSAIASLAAVPVDYMTGHTLSDLCWAGLTTYLKLSCIMAGLILGKRIVESRARSVNHSG